MNAHSLESFQSQLAMLLRDQPRGTTADMTEFAVAYWDGHQVVYCFLRDDGSGHIEEEFDMADYVWEEWEPALASWLVDPKFTPRPEVRVWLKEAPPYNAGA